MVQTRWTYLNRHYNVLTEVQAILLDGLFVLEIFLLDDRGLLLRGCAQQIASRALRV